MKQTQAHAHTHALGTIVSDSMSVAVLSVLSIRQKCCCATVIVVLLAVCCYLRNYRSFSIVRSIGNCFGVSSPLSAISFVLFIVFLFCQFPFVTFGCVCFFSSLLSLGCLFFECVCFGMKFFRSNFNMTCLIICLNIYMFGEAFSAQPKKFQTETSTPGTSKQNGINIRYLLFRHKLYRCVCSRGECQCKSSTII